nr:C4-type zinc ribbon domain-containing protein [Corynebacterium mendelii]
MSALDRELKAEENKLARTTGPTPGETTQFADSYRAAEKDYRRRAAELAADKAELTERLQALLDQLDPADAKELRAQTRATGVCAVVFSGRSCPGCQMVLSPAEVKTIEQTDKDEVARCPQCGTFLVLGGDHERKA